MLIWTNPYNVSSMMLHGLSSSTPLNDLTLESKNTSKFSQLSYLFFGLGWAGSRAIAVIFSNNDYSSVINRDNTTYGWIRYSSIQCCTCGASNATGFPTSVSSSQKIPSTSWLCT